jgi:hypothetical protein
MQQHFEIHPSTRQASLLFGAHCVLALLLLAYVEQPLLRFCAAVLVMLIGWREYRLAARQGVILLHCDPRAARIALQQDGQPYFYCKYKVYATRWFAILRLDDKRNSRTLILNSECFDSEHSYRRLRYLLAQMELTSAA